MAVLYPFRLGLAHFETDERSAEQRRRAMGCLIGEKKLLRAANIPLFNALRNPTGRCCYITALVGRRNFVPSIAAAQSHPAR